MAKVPVQLKEAAALTKKRAGELPPGQAHWWLRSELDFVRLPERVRGDKPLDVTVELEPGTYTLGVGPTWDGVRKEITVEAPRETAAQKKKKEKEAAKAAEAAQATPAGSIPVKGKTFVLTGDLDAMDRDAAKAWLV